MQRIVATLIKEVQLLLKDRTGFVILFVMPVLLVLIMTLIQNQAYKSLNEAGVPVLFINFDNDSLGTAIERGFEQNPICKLQVYHPDSTANFEERVAFAKKEVLQGTYLVALIVPPGASQMLREDVERMMDGFMNGDSLVVEEKPLEQIHIEIITDPVARKSFVMAITSGLRELVASVKTRVLFQIMTQKMSSLIGADTSLELPESDFFVFNESAAVSDSQPGLIPNATQHNVPAWAIFSIFFMVLPLASSMINERITGMHARMMTFPGSYLSIISGKIIAYIIIANIQFLLVISMGKFVLPLLGMPMLHLGDQWLALVALTFSVSLAAVSYGLMVGSIFNTQQQSAVFGGISILILSALGGIWVPLNIMPATMQQIANISPLNWALKGYYEIFIRGGGWLQIKWEVMKLVLFFAGNLLFAAYFQKLKRN